MQIALAPILRTCLLTFSFLFAFSEITITRRIGFANAQVTPDNSVNTQVEQNGSVAEITGGETRGDNLFHSFEDFSVPTNDEAFFDNANDISNIFSRVTGGNISNIDGAIRANGSANLFLINPAGIIFGEGASLDIGGSFYGSSASSILFEDGEFSAADIDNPPLLTVNAPIGLSFRDNPGDIALNPGSELGVSPSKTLALVGGNISFNNGIIFPTDLRQLGTIVEIGGLTEAGTVKIEENGRLGFPENTERGDVFLVNNSSINAFSEGGGEVVINARNFELSSNARIFGGILPATSNSSTTQSGDIVINATEDVSIDGTDSELVSITNDVITTDTGQAGKITISGKNISLINGGTISSTVTNSNQGRSSEITLTARENITLGGTDLFLPSSISSTTVLNEGDTGEFNIQAQNLTIESGAFIESSILSMGNSGNININISDTVLIDGRSSRIQSNISDLADDIEGTGNTGNIDLQAGNLLLSNGGRLSASITGEGDAGNINISTDNISIDGTNSEISSNAIRNLNVFDTTPDEVNQNNAGNIAITTNFLSITNAGDISTSTTSIGNAGNIEITANNSILIDGTSDGSSGIPSIIRSDVVSFADDIVAFDAIGNSGDVKINTPKLSVTNGGVISTSTFADGNAGNLTLLVSESLEVSNDGVIQAEVFEGATGTGGNLSIETKNLTIDNGAQISASTRAGGDAGNLTVRATDSITVSGETETGPSALLAIAQVENGSGGELNIFTKELIVNDNAIISVGNFPLLEGRREPGTGEPGNLNIQANTIDVDSGGSISAETQSSIGEGANINLQVAEDITLRDNGLISAEAVNEGNGGNLEIDSRFLIAFPNGNSDIIASAEQGQGGNIRINAESVFGIEERPLNDATNDISASSEVFGLEGNISLETIDFNPLQGVVEVVERIIVPQETTTQACNSDREAAAGNGLNIGGKGGVPPAPDLPLSSETVVDKDEVQDISQLPKPIVTSIGKIQPARGIEVTDKGIKFTAYRTNNAGERLPEIKENCGV